MISDFIVLHRKFMNWEWASSPNMVTVFLHCLLKANYKDGRFQGVEVPRGTFVMSQEGFSSECGLTRQQLRTALKKLESTGEISQKTTSRFTLITVCNYCKYQDYQPADNQQITNEQPADNQQITTRETKKQRNKETNISSLRSDNADSFVEDGFKKPFEDFLTYRKKIKKPIKEASLKVAYENMKKLSGENPKTAEQIVLQSIANGWQGLFALKNTGSPGGAASAPEADKRPASLQVGSREWIEAERAKILAQQEKTA